MRAGISSNKIQSRLSAVVVLFKFNTSQPFFFEVHIRFYIYFSSSSKLISRKKYFLLIKIVLLIGFNLPTSKKTNQCQGQLSNALKMRVFYAFCLILVVLPLATNARTKEQKLTVDDLLKKFLELEENLWNFVFDTKSNGVKENTQPEVELIKRLKEFGDVVQKEMPNDLTHGLELLENVWSYQLAYADLRSIYALYETFRRFETLQTGPGRIPSPKLAWIDLTSAILYDGQNNVNESLERINDLIFVKQLFSDVRKEAENEKSCETKQSAQQVIYNLYNTIALTELKGYAMVQFSYMLLKLFDHGNFTKESQFMNDHFVERKNDLVKVVKVAMEKSSRHLWKCDPNPRSHVKGETYEEITELIQGYVQNEVDLNSDNTCKENCAAYQYAKSHGCFKNLYCRQQRKCNGKIIKCEYVDSDMWICPAAPNSGRRYNYIEYENGRVLGRKNGGCDRGTTKVDSWWRWLFWHCSYCFCYCDEQGPMSDRYFNLRPSIANISSNRVITGLRFVKKNRIIHLQIQEGLLLPRGKIDNGTIRWVPVDDYKITDQNVLSGSDYHTLTYEKRAVDLDDLEVSDGHVLTGVRFKEIGSHLNFEIYMSPFDFVSGKLIQPQSGSYWKDNPNTDASFNNPRTQIYMKRPDIPTRTLKPSIPDSTTDQYIEFIYTDMDKDAAQTTVPFLDAQKVESLIAVPLSGAGIFHKGRENFGGFIAPKIITYDFSKHMEIHVDGDDEPMVN